MSNTPTNDTGPTRRDYGGLIAELREVADWLEFYTSLSSKDAKCQIVVRRVVQMGFPKLMGSLLVHKREIAQFLRSDFDRLVAAAEKVFRLAESVELEPDSLKAESAFNIADGDFRDTLGSVIADLRQVASELEQSGRGGKKTRGKKKAVDDRTLIKKLHMDIVREFVKAKDWRGSYRELSLALEKEKNLTVKYSTLWRYAKEDPELGRLMGRMGKPHGPAKGRGEREGVADEGPADLSGTDSWTTPDDDNESVS